MRLLDLDVGRGQQEFRTPRNLTLLTQLMMPYDERVLVNCLKQLAEGNRNQAAAMAINESRKGSLIPDIHLLAGAFHLAEGRFSEAADTLSQCYQAASPPGLAIRRVFPSLRFQLRISPCTLAPVYPNAYGAGILLAVAQWRAGLSGEALEVLREMVEEWGLFDDLKLLAGQIYLERDQLDRAVQALKTGDDTQRDALELARNLYLAYAYYRREQYRSAARALSPVVTMVTDVNPHLHARARLLLAECFERNKMLLNALRQSAHVAPEEIPDDVAAVVLAREERWVTELQLLTNPEIERLANADQYQAYLPETSKKAEKHSPLDTSRDPLKKMKVTAKSWRKRQEEERAIADYKAAVAMGKPVKEPFEQSLSGAGREIKRRIEIAAKWWPSRREALKSVRPREALAHSDAANVGHIRFDFQGTREMPKQRLAGEKRAALLVSIGGTAILIMVILWIMRACVY